MAYLALPPKYDTKNISVGPCMLLDFITGCYKDSFIHFYTATCHITGPSIGANNAGDGQNRQIYIIKIYIKRKRDNIKVEQAFQEIVWFPLLSFYPIYFKYPIYIEFISFTSLDHF